MHIFHKLPIYVYVVILIVITIGDIAFIKEPEDCFFIVGERNVLLPCQATTSSSLGIISIIWKHNDSWINSIKNSNYYVFPNGSLFFKTFLNTNVGVYTCTAVLLVDDQKIDQRSSRKAKVQAAYISETFYHITRYISAKHGSKVYLQCVTPDSIPLPTVTWKRNGQILTGYKNQSVVVGNHVSNTLEIKKLFYNYTGDYQCCVVNRILPEKMLESDVIPVQIEADQDKPYFLLKPSPVTVSRFQKILLHCIVMGNPVPNVTWKKGKLPLSNDSRHHIVLSNGSLVIFRAEKKDENQYSCVGENLLGSIESVSIQLTVAYIDFDFTENPQNKFITSGDTLLMNCQPPKSHPVKPSIAWFFEYKKLDFTSRLKLLSNNSLVVQNITLMEEGRYFCQAVHPFTKQARSSTQAFVTVNVMPSISIERNYAVISKHKLEVTANVSGKPKPTVTISREFDNRSLVRLTNFSTLFVETASLSIDGKYVVTAENEAGIVKKSFTVVVYVPPFFLRRPSNNSVSVGKAAKISIEVNGKPTPNKISWFFRSPLNLQVNKPLYNTSNLMVNQDAISFSNASKTDEGWYTVFASNVAGKVTETVYFKVHVPAVIASLTSNKKVQVRQNLSVSCLAIGDPKPRIQWQFNGENMTSNSPLTETLTWKNLTANMESVLHMYNVSVNHHGNYTCLVENAYGRQKQQISVSVIVYPEVNDMSITGSLELGSNITISCNGYGSPSPEIYIRHNGSIVKTVKGNTYRQTLQLVLENITAADSGTYECSIKNEAGVDNRNETIAVKVYPHPPRLLNVTALSSNTIWLKWMDGFNGCSEVLYYEIALEDLELNSTRIQTLNSTFTDHTISKLRPYTSYTVKIQVQNEVGASGFSNIWTLKTESAAPSKVIGFSVVNKTSRTLHLNWRNPTTLNGIIRKFEILSFVGNMALFQQQSPNGTILYKQTLIPINTPKTLYQFVLTDLVPNTDYVLRIRASTRNRLGNHLWGDYSKDVIAKTLLEVPSVMVGSINVSNVTSRSFTITFPPPNSTFVYGSIIGYHVVIRAKLLNEDEMKSFIINKTSVTLGNLHAFTWYSLQIAVVNELGRGPYTPETKVKTKTGVPGPVVNIFSTVIHNRSIEFKWKEPDAQNGIIEGYTLKFTRKSLSQQRNESEDFIQETTGNETIFSTSTFTANSTYWLNIIAKTSSGPGNVSKPHKFFVDEYFIGMIKPIDKNTRVTLASKSVVLQWLDREYLVVIVALASFSGFLLLLFIAIFCARCYHSGQSRKDYDDSKKQRVEIDSGKHIDEDFIWDDNLIAQIVEGSSLETERTKMDQKKKSKNESKYIGVEPYQGKRIELSPLVRLKGMDKTKRHPKIFNPGTINGGKSPLRKGTDLQELPMPRRMDREETWKRGINEIVDSTLKRRYLEDSHVAIRMDPRKTERLRQKRESQTIKNSPIGSRIRVEESPKIRRNHREESPLSTQIDLVESSKRGRRHLEESPTSSNPSSRRNTPYSTSSRNPSTSSLASLVPSTPSARTSSNSSNNHHKGNARKSRKQQYLDEIAVLSHGALKPMDYKVQF